jgi:membrane fusion protein, multidrug efflux system
MRKTLLLKITVPLVLLALGVGSAWWLVAHKAELDKAKVKTVKHEPPMVIVTTAKPETLRMDVQSQGVITPRHELALVPEVSGKVVNVHPGFAAGGFFRKGELLLAIDQHDYQFAVIRAKAAVAESYKELMREQEEAQQAAEEWQALGSGKATDYVLHKPQVHERQAKLAAAQADLDAARLQLARCRLLAPFTGWVRDKSVSAGQYLSAGEKIAQLYADSNAEVRLPIASDQVEFLALPSPGADLHSWPEVKIKVRFGSKEQSWQGRIIRIASHLDDQNAMLYAIADIPDAFKADAGHPPLLPGMFVHAEIAGIERSDLIRLPRRALRGGNQVYSVDNDQRLRLHTIDILRSDKDHLIVTKGVAAGDHILIAGVDLPVDGMRVKIKSPATIQQSAALPGTDG